MFITIKLFLSLSLSLLINMTLLGKQHSGPSKPPLGRKRCRGQRGRTKQGSLGVDNLRTKRVVKRLKNSNNK